MEMEKDGGTEAEYLESQSDGGASEQALEDDIREYEAIYEANKKAGVGQTTSCPVCYQPFAKGRKNQVFPSGHTKCKDRYWNTVNEGRRERAIFFA